MNIRATLKALEIQAPSSNPTPTFPFKSAKPNVSNRPVTVTIPAPSTTPRIPSSGLCDKSIGRVAVTEDGTAEGRFAGNGMDVALISLFDYVSVTSSYAPLLQQRGLAAIAT